MLPPVDVMLKAKDIAVPPIKAAFKVPPVILLEIKFVTFTLLPFIVPPVMLLALIITYRNIICCYSSCCNIVC